MEKQTITIYDVAREAGVSMATVSRVVNGNPNVKPSTRQKVSEVIDRLNYRPNAVARGLASKRTTTVGVIIPSVTNLFYSTLARGIDDIAAMYRYTILMANSDENTERKTKVFQSLEANQVDGIVYMGDSVEEDFVKEISRSNVPVVFAGTMADKYEDGYSVNIDYQAATYEITKELLDRGRKVALLTGPAEYYVSQVRVDGFKQAIADQGESYNSDYVLQGDFKINEAAELLDSLLDLGVTGLVTVDDQMAASILNEAIDRGIQIPDDFEIITSQNTIVTKLTRPELSSIESPLYDIGAVAMRLLTKVMGKEDIDEHHVILPHRFVKRGTSK
ncbi:substrate-binding domain-containing protein [Hutsoniella sourekii]|uniref:substrate-binding domain-containing protein n=1 Tax=Hutsoniella sourekii TaxID=87650 RepID=UPI00048940D3|nr:substrate-binding domain-containing protein [Hutsoniella sourekii]